MGGLRDPLFMSREDRILRGVKRTAQVNSPAAGSDWTVTVPAGKQWRIRSIFAQFAASATVANRNPALVITDGNVNVFAVVTIPSQVASQTLSYTWIPSLATALPTGLTGNNIVPVMPGWLPPEYTISTLTGGLQAADQWSKVALAVEELYMDDTLISDRYFGMLDRIVGPEADWVEAYGHLPEQPKR